MTIWRGIGVCGRRGQSMCCLFSGKMSITSGLISLIICENRWLAQLCILLLTSTLMLDSNIYIKTFGTACWQNAAWNTVLH